MLESKLKKESELSRKTMGLKNIIKAGASGKLDIQDIEFDKPATEPKQESR